MGTGRQQLQRVDLLNNLMLSLVQAAEQTKRWDSAVMLTNTSDINGSAFGLTHLFFSPITIATVTMFLMGSFLLVGYFMHGNMSCLFIMAHQQTIKH